MVGYLHNILISYINTTHANLNLSSFHPCLVIFDSFKGQTADAFLNTLDKNNILVVEIPQNCTDRLQPLDLAVNKPLKDQMKKQLHYWYAGEVRKKLKATPGTGNDNNKVVDSKLTRLKPHGMQWLVDTCSSVERNDFIQIGYSEAGITSAMSHMFDFS